MKYLLAVSGGVDSVVLLDILSRSGRHDLVVAHVDHGIRADSADDARFVEALAAKYGLLFVSKRFELGARASEDVARKARYEFLFDEAKRQEAVLMTAHHLDDTVETIAINLTRGTGHRGLAVLNRAGISRPMLGYTKEQIYDYALKHGLEYVEDSTNHSKDYLRNRLRELTRGLEVETKGGLLELRDRQIAIEAEIDKEIEQILPDHMTRHLFIAVDPDVADELLRAAFLRHRGVSPTRPQRERALLAIKTASPGSITNVGSGFSLHFSKREFRIHTS